MAVMKVWGKKGARVITLGRKARRQVLLRKEGKSKVLKNEGK